MIAMYPKNVTVCSLSVMVCVCLLLCVVPSVFATDSDSRSKVEGTVSAEIAALHQTALSGSAESQYQLGELFEYGRGVQQNDSKAVYWYEKSAAQDFASAQYRLGVLYDNGWGGPVNKEKALVFYKGAAEQGLTFAQHDIAIAYFQGSGVEKHLLQAYKWLRIAVLTGNPLMLKHLRVVAAEMSPAQIDTANKLADVWVEKSRQ